MNVSSTDWRLTLIHESDPSPEKKKIGIKKKGNLKYNWKYSELFLFGCPLIKVFIRGDGSVTGVSVQL